MASRESVRSFALSAAKYLEQDGDCGDFEECYQMALDNPNDTWNYLWWLNTEDSRSICKKYLFIV